jgi:hypothetical protein
MLKKRNCILRIVSAPLRARETPWNPRIQRKNNELRPQLFFRLDFGEIQRVYFSQKMNQTVKIQRVAKSRGFGANPGKSSATKRALRARSVHPRYSYTVFENTAIMTTFCNNGCIVQYSRFPLCRK